jgi:hypothetical protein
MKSFQDIKKKEIDKPEIPQDLHGYSATKLGCLKLVQLKEECKKRGLKPGSSKDVCVKRLLKWKESKPSMKSSTRKEAKPNTKNSQDVKSKKIIKPEIPQDLRGYSATKLGGLTHDQLKEECKRREVVQGRNVGVCVERLLEWKSRNAPTPSRVTAKQINKSSKIILHKDLKLVVAGKGMKDLRKPVDKKKAEVWEIRNNKDIYQDKLKRYIRGEIEVDHIIECQIVNRVLDCMPRSFTRKANLLPIQDAVNGYQNLNNTTKAINKAKWGPFARWKHQLEIGEVVVTSGKSVETFVTENLYDKFIDTGIWPRMKKAIVNSFDGVQNEAMRNASNHQTEIHVEEFMEQLHRMLESMKMFE